MELWQVGCTTKDYFTMVHCSHDGDKALSSAGIWCTAILNLFNTNIFFLSLSMNYAFLIAFGPKIFFDKQRKSTHICMLIVIMYSTLIHFMQSCKHVDWMIWIFLSRFQECNETYNEKSYIKNKKHDASIWNISTCYIKNFNISVQN